MDFHELIQKILSAGNCPIPGEVATELLAIAHPDDLPNSLLNFDGFSGDGQLAVARSSQVKAKLVAANTSDQEVHRALFEMLKAGDLVGPEVVACSKVDDGQLLVDIHRLVWEDHVGDRRFEKIRNEVLTRVPLEYQLEYVAHRYEGRNYPLAEVGHRIGTELASGGFWALEYATIILTKHSGSRQSVSGERVAESIGRSLAHRSSSRKVMEVLTELKKSLEPKWYDRVLRAAYFWIEVVDDDLLAEMLSTLPSPEDFKVEQERMASKGGRVYFAPVALSRSNRMFTIPALRRLASTFPAELAETIRSAAYEPGDIGEILEISASCDHPLVASAMLTRRWDGVNAPTRLTARQFKAAVKTLTSHKGAVTPNYGQKTIPSSVAAWAIPADASREDVAALLGNLSQPDEVLYELYSTQLSNAAVYRPSVPDFVYLFENLSEENRIKAAFALLRLWRYYSHKDEAHRTPEGFNAVFAAVVSTIPVCDLLRQSDGPKYLAHVLAENFGTDKGSWITALSLAAKSKAPLSKVLKAARRLA